MTILVLVAMQLSPAGARADGPSPGTAVPGAGSVRSTLTVALLQRVDSLNPFLGISAPAVQLLGLAYDRLTDYSPVDNRPVPGLAESWRTSPDGLTWTFTIRDDARWSDGRPLSAEDVAFTYTTLMKNPASVNAGLVRSFVSVRAPGPGTVVIKTSVPTPTMLALDIPIVPAHVWRHRDPLAEPSGGGGADLVGSGPFRVVEASPGQRYRLVRNGGHWRGSPRVDELVFRYFTNSDAAVQALRKGEVDLVSNLTPAQFDAVRADRGIATNEARGSRFTHLGFNPGAARSDGRTFGDGHPALRDPVVRAAIERAIDRRTLVSRVLGGHGDPGAGYFPRTYQPWSWQPGEGVLRAFDPDAANRMLDEAGYRRNRDGLRTMPPGGPAAGRELSFRLFVPVERAHYQQSGRFIVEWLRAVGIGTELTPMADTQLNERVDAGAYDMFISGWLLDPDPDFLLSVHTCAARPTAGGGGSTDAFVCDPELDEAYRRQSREVDAARRVELVRRVQQRLYTIAGQVTLYYPTVLEAYRSDRFTDLTRRPAGTGSIAGPWSYVTARPRAVPAAGAGGPGRAGAVAVALSVAALAALIGLVVWRRRATRDLRE